jgi:hypothetical protein
LVWPGEPKRPTLAQADHALGGTPGAAEGAGEVGVEDAVELLVAHPHEQGVLGDAGIGDQHLDRAAEGLLGRREGRVDGGGVGHLAAHAHQALGRLTGAVGDRDPVALGGESAGNGQPDASVATGDEDVAWFRHRSPSCLRCRLAGRHPCAPT